MRRLIEADMAKKTIDICSCSIGGEMGKALMHLYKWSKELIDTVPTAEAVPLDVLREIRSEIQEMHDKKPGDPYEMGKHLAFGQVLGIIDKYIKEREAEE